MANEVMKSLNFGVEIEFTGITRERAAAEIANLLGTSSSYHGGSYREYHVGSNLYFGDERIWKVCRDASVSPQRKHGFASDDYKCELVTPILRYEDIETLQKIVRALRAAGAMVNKSCGLHIHVGAERFTPKNLRNIANIFYAKEDLIYKAIECDSNHRDLYYCQKTDTQFIDRLNKLVAPEFHTIKQAWYGDAREHDHHYDSSRYHGLNLHAYYTKGTVEFRCFNSTLHAGKVKSYIQLCLGIAQLALTQSKTKAIKKTFPNEKLAFVRWLRRLGLLGEEFKTAHKHLMEHLPGVAYVRHAA